MTKDRLYNLAISRLVDLLGHERKQADGQIKTERIDKYLSEIEEIEAMLNRVIAEFRCWELRKYTYDGGWGNEYAIFWAGVYQIKILADNDESAKEVFWKTIEPHKRRLENAF